MFDFAAGVIIAAILGLLLNLAIEMSENRGRIL